MFIFAEDERFKQIGDDDFSGNPKSDFCFLIAETKS